MARAKGSRRPDAPGRRHRVVLWIAVLLVGLVVVDKAAELLTERRLGGRIQRAEHLQQRPEVDIHGLVFLAQVVRGTYGRVTLSSQAPISAAGIRIDHADATLHSVRVRVSDAWRGTVPDVPVRSGEGSAVVPYAAVNAAVKKYGGTAGSLVTVVGDGRGHAKLEGPFGVSVRITATVRDAQLVITPSASDLSALPDSISSEVTSALASPVPLPPFPFNITLASGSFQSDGLHLAAAAHYSVFPVR